MKISIVTVCYNMANTIESTILSVLSQKYENIEYIIIDGKSTDNTLSIIEKYRDKIDYFISEKDNGIYNAMNKGIRASTGDIIYFLNSDDVLLHENVISLVVEQFKPEDLIIYGNMITLDRSSGKLELLCFNRPGRMFLFYNFIPHQATFYRKILFTNNGLFNEENKIVSDYEYSLLLAIKNKVKLKYINLTISIFAFGGESGRDLILHAKERDDVLKKYFSPLEYFIYKTRIMSFINRKIRTSQPSNYRRY